MRINQQPNSRKEKKQCRGPMNQMDRIFVNALRALNLVATRWVG